jgi:hypothetical protein
MSDLLGPVCVELLGPCSAAGSSLCWDIELVLSFR